MSMYCGTDIIEVERIKNTILNTPGFKEKVYTFREIEIGDNKGEEVKYQYYAGRFAAKEAVYKSLSKICGEELWLGDIEILNDKENLNRPYVVINKDKSNKLKNIEKFQIDVSISHIREYAIASAITQIPQ